MVYCTTTKRYISVDSWEFKINSYIIHQTCLWEECLCLDRNNTTSLLLAATCDQCSRKEENDLIIKLSSSRFSRAASGNISEDQKCGAFSSVELSWLSDKCRYLVCPEVFPHFPAVTGGAATYLPPPKNNLLLIPKTLITTKIFNYSSGYMGHFWKR